MLEVVSGKSELKENGVKSVTSEEAIGYAYSKLHALAESFQRICIDDDVQRNRWMAENALTQTALLCDILAGQIQYGERMFSLMLKDRVFGELEGEQEGSEK